MSRTLSDDLDGEALRDDAAPGVIEGGGIAGMSADGLVLGKAIVEGEPLGRQGEVCLSWSAMRGRGRVRLGMGNEGRGDKQPAAAR